MKGLLSAAGVVIGTLSVSVASMNATSAAGIGKGRERLLAAPSTVARPTLTLEGARAVVDRAMEECRRLNAGPSVAVVDDGGHLVCFARTDGSFAAGAEVSIGKARTAAMFKKATRVFEDSINKGRFAMLDARPDFTPLQGGVPIVVDGQIVGAVGVSGAASAQQDDEIATAAAGALAGVAASAEPR
jgi:glc operon protein GlcG